MTQTTDTHVVRANGSSPHGTNGSTSPASGGLGEPPAWVQDQAARYGDAGPAHGGGRRSKRAAPATGVLLDRDYTIEQLDLLYNRAERKRKMVMGATWTVAAGVMIYSLVTVGALGVELGLVVQVAYLVGLFVDAGLIASFWVSDTLSQYNVRNPWVTFLRWLTGFTTLALNVAHSILLPPDNPTPLRVGFAIFMSAIGPIMLIGLSEMAFSSSRRIGVIVAAISEKRAEVKGIKANESEKLQELTARFAEVQERGELAERNAAELRVLAEATLLERDGLLHAVSRTRAMFLGTYGRAHGNVVGHAIVDQLSRRPTPYRLMEEADSSGDDNLDSHAQRLIVFKASEGTLVLADSEHPHVQETVDRLHEETRGQGGKAELFDALPGKTLITLRESDLEARAHGMLTDGTLEGYDREVLLSAVGTGDIGGVDQPIIHRIVVRAALHGGRMSTNYSWVARTRRAG